MQTEGGFAINERELIFGEEEEEKETKLLGSTFMASGDNYKNTNTHQTTTQLELLHLHHHQQQQHQIHEHQISFGMMQSSSSAPIPGNYLGSKESGAYELGELDQALFLYLDGQTDQSSSVHDQRPFLPGWEILQASNGLFGSQEKYVSRSRFISADQNSSSNMRPPTLNIFPSQPMHVEPPPSSKASLELASPQSSDSKRKSEPPMELANPQSEAVSAPEPPPKTGRRENHRKGITSSSEQEGPKTPDPKTLRRLAQNREAARKSRLRKKAYVQQLESSRIRLNQLEQELQRGRAQASGIFFGGGAFLGGEQALPVAMTSISSEAAMFDMEYARWQEEQHRLMCELRAAILEHLGENELRLFVDNYLGHYDQLVNLKSILARTDVFHLIWGMWKTPAERFFMWIGGFRPSEIIKIILSQIEPLTEQQILGVCALQQSTQEAEEALSQGLETLNHSLSSTLQADSLSFQANMGNYMGQMAVAMNKLSTVEGFLRQADNLRQQTLQRLNQILTTRQAARCLVAIGEYYHRLRALSSLWMARPRHE